MRRSSLLQYAEGAPSTHRLVAHSSSRGRLLVHQLIRDGSTESGLRCPRGDVATGVYCCRFLVLYSVFSAVDIVLLLLAILLLIAMVATT